MSGPARSYPGIKWPHQIVSAGMLDRSLIPYGRNKHARRSSSGIIAPRYWLMALFYLGYMLTETLKTNIDTLFIPGLRFVLLFSVTAQRHALQNWSRIYGPWASNSFVVISDAFIARDLLVSNSVMQWEYEYYIKCRACQAILLGCGITVTEKERCQRLGK